MLFFRTAYFEPLINTFVKPKRSKPDLALAIATLLRELKRVRKKLVTKEKTWSETQAKIEDLKQIATEKHRLNMAQVTAKLKAQRYPEGLPGPDPNDIPEEQEIARLLENPRLTTGPPVIDPQVRMNLLWLSADPLAKVVLDELDKVLRHPRLDGVDGMIAFLAKFPGGAVPLRTPGDSGGATHNRVSEREPGPAPRRKALAPSLDDASDEASAKMQAERGKTRSAWLNRQLFHQEPISDPEIASQGGPSYNTIRRYRSGKESSRDAYVRGLFAKVFGRDISEVPE